MSLLYSGIMTEVGVAVTSMELIELKKFVLWEFLLILIILDIHAPTCEDPWSTQLRDHTLTFYSLKDLDLII